MDATAGGGQRKVHRRVIIVVVFVVTIRYLQSRRDDMVFHSREIIGERRRRARGCIIPDGRGIRRGYDEIFHPHVLISVRSGRQGARLDGAGSIGTADSLDDSFGR